MAPLKSPAPDLPVVLFKTPAAWEAWLAKHGSASAGVWLRLAKKSAALQSVSYAEALDVALCYGWIDGQKKAGDEETWLQRFTPRGPKSLWSKINRAKALALIQEGRMQTAGLAAIERAKANGQWETAYDGQRTAALPADLATALDQCPKAKAFFATLDSQNRFAILFRLQSAKKPETRQKRLDQFVSLLEKGEKLYP
jgi:uncharacterized protein YdeI (YjbR/CyaY-like superfamily)